ncbi:MAG: transglycosylase domain-containing protein [Proteobacteria bacterium]|nr:transglycosylase domain-containing protein [Pseudomonadota bacterium]
MFKIKQRWWIGAIVAALVASLFTLGLRPMLERAVRARIEAAAVRHGMVARIGAVHVGVWPMLRLDDLDLDFGQGARLRANTVAATWPGQLRLAVHAATITVPGDVTVSLGASAWRLAGAFGGELQLALLEPQAGLQLRRQAEAAGSAWTVEARGLDVGRLLDMRRDGHALLNGGIADGHMEIQSGPGTVRFRVDFGVRSARLGALAGNSTDDLQPGDPTDVTLRFEGAWQRERGAINIPKIQATVAGAVLSGSLALTGLDTDPAIDLALGARQLDFAQLLGASGLDVPDSLGLASGSRHDLGSATIDLQVRGRLAVPASLAVSQKVAFKPPRELPPGITRLRGEFPFSVTDGVGRQRTIDVAPASPDFIALGEVPPLFLRTLLLAEDAGFYGHRGIDLSELPAALLTNWSRGTAARGASTISQQLAKNLFLSRDKQLGRKLQELAITFLLESALGKARILEIYLNIIEWGPDLRGLRPAARRYFGREPRALTAAQTAFLVAIIPGPIKYQNAFARGTPAPGLRSLIDDLLAKLRSVDALSEEEYRQALDEQLVVAIERPDG